MTPPPSPLAHALETLTEVRKALAYLPQLCSDLRWVEAVEVVEEQLVQLAVLRAEWTGLGELELLDAIESTKAYAGASRVLIDLDRQDRLEVSDRPLSSPEALPRPNPDIGFADEPLF